MNRKLLIFALITAGFFLFTACDSEGPPVDDLWNKIRNTTWEMKKEKTYNEGKFDFTYTIGFYAPYNGPNSQYYSNGYDSMALNLNNKVYPYVKVRRVSYNPPENNWVKPGQYDFSEYDIQINRTGHQILQVNYNYENGEKSEKSIERLFSVSLSEDGEKLKISSVNLPWDTSEADRMSGTYTKVSVDPKFSFDEGRKETLGKIQNTAWTKQGNSNISVGFYSNRYKSIDFLLRTQDGFASEEITIKEDGVYFSVYTYEREANGMSVSGTDSHLTFKIIVNDNTLTISITPEKRYEWDEKTQSAKELPINPNNLRFNDDIGYYGNNTGTRYSNDKFCELFNGTYTKTPYFSGRDKLWDQIKNTAWKKTSDSTPSLGFYELGKGELSNTYPIHYGYIGYVLFTDASNTFRDYPLLGVGYVQKGINIDGTKININGDVFNISSDGNTTLNISGGTNYTSVNGTYTNVSSDPNYSWY